MSISDYISPNETIISHISVETNDSSVLESTFGVTAKKIFWFKKLKDHNIEYRDMPLEKITSIENYWHNRHIGKIILGISLVIIAFGLFIYFGFFSLIMLFPLFIIGIVLIRKGLKQYGQFNVIGIQKIWEFQFRRKEETQRIQQFIRSIYHIIPSTNIELIPKQAKKVEVSNLISVVNGNKLLEKKVETPTLSQKPKELSTSMSEYVRRRNMSIDNEKLEKSKILIKRTELPEEIKYCSTCGEEIRKKAIYCEFCGSEQ